MLCCAVLWLRSWNWKRKRLVEKGDVWWGGGVGKEGWGRRQKKKKKKVGFEMWIDGVLIYGLVPLFFPIRDFFFSFFFFFSGIL